MPLAEPPKPAQFQLSPGDAAIVQKARSQLTNGHSIEALPTYLNLVKRLPTIPSLWFECGLAALGALEFEVARRSFAQARELAPRDAHLLIALGQQYHRLRNPELARACFEAAAKAEPDSVHANLSLASWLEREHKLDVAWECVTEILARHPSDPAASYYKAFLLQRKKRAVEAEPILRDLLAQPFKDANLRVSCCHLLAVVLDDLGQYEEAFRWLGESKAEARRAGNVAAFEQSYEQGSRARRQLLEGITAKMIETWRRETPPSALPHPLALLGGHPRSGTTLLELILGAHPNVLAFDESEAFAAQIWDPLSPIRQPASSAEELHTLSPSRCSGLRARYFKSLLRELEAPPQGKILIDKNPAPTAVLYFWLRLFPAAKVIITLRDPRDVVLSCYFQQLTLTPMNVNFLSLERTANQYAALMDVWLKLRDLGGFDWIETRYEDFATDLEKEARRVNNFLGLEWHPDQAKSHEAASRRLVFAPTYADVTDPAHGRAIGRWRRYEKALAAVEPRLAKYCAAFGY